MDTFEVRIQSHKDRRKITLSNQEFSATSKASLNLASSSLACPLVCLPKENIVSSWCLHQTEPTHAVVVYYQHHCCCCLDGGGCCDNGTVAADKSGYIPPEYSDLVTISDLGSTVQCQTDERMSVFWHSPVMVIATQSEYNDHLNNNKYLEARATYNSA